MVDIPKIQGRLLDQGSSEPSSNAGAAIEFKNAEWFSGKQPGVTGFKKTSIDNWFFRVGVTTWYTVPTENLSTSNSPPTKKSPSRSQPPHPHQDSGGMSPDHVRNAVRQFLIRHTLWVHQKRREVWPFYSLKKRKGAQFPIKRDHEKSINRYQQIDYPF